MGGPSGLESSFGQWVSLEVLGVLMEILGTQSFFGAHWQECFHPLFSSGLAS